MKGFLAWFGFAVLVYLVPNDSVHAVPKESAIKIRSVDTFVVGDKTLVPGTLASLRIVTSGVTSLVSSKPLPLATVVVTISNSQKKNQLLFQGRSDLMGVTEAHFLVPDWPEGSYEMRVQTQSPFGKGQLTQTVTLKRTGKILLVTDKPIYQPGQLMHMRALALNSFDLKPLGELPVNFEIQDPKGNKVFKREMKTDAFGIISADFQLADEINLGNYQIETAAVNREACEVAQKTVVVKKYVLPKFKVEAESDKEFYLPKETIRGKIHSNYFFGKPVSDAQVEVQASTFDVAFKEFANLRGRTGMDGSFEFELKLPDTFVGQPLQKGDAVVKLEVKVTDSAKHVERTVKTIPVAATPIRLDAVPEGGRLVPGVENRILVIATYPDGSPAQAQVVMKLADQEIANTKTDETGLGAFVLTPQEKDMKDGGFQPTGSFGMERRLFAVQRPAYVHTKALDLKFLGRDSRGNRCEVVKSFSTDPVNDQILLTTDKAIYKTAESIRATVLTTSGEGTCYLDIIKNGQTLLTRSLSVKKGKGTFEIPLSAELFGTLELHAYKLLSNGEILRDARVLYVQPPAELQITVSRDKSVYRPGEEALFKFQVVDQTGQPTSAALGVIIVDEAVYALQELKPGLEKVYFTLEKELADPKYEIEFGPSEDLASLIKTERLQTQKQQVAKALLAKVQPQGNPVLWQNPTVDRLQKAERDRYLFQQALYSTSPTQPIAKRTSGGKLEYQDDLVAKMVAAKMLPVENSKDPLGDPYTMATAQALWPEMKAETFLLGLELQRLWNLRYAIYNDLSSRTSNFSKNPPKGFAAAARESFNSVLSQPYIVKTDVTGKPYRFDDLQQLPGFRVEDMFGEIHVYRVQLIHAALSQYGADSERWYRISVLDKKLDAYVFPDDVLQRLIKRGSLNAEYAKDLWGNPFRLRRLKEPLQQVYYDNRLRFIEVYSLGPDGKDGTADDLSYPYPVSDGGYQALAKALGYVQPVYGMGMVGGRGGFGEGRIMADEMAMGEPQMAPARDGEFREHAAKMAMPTASTTAVQNQEVTKGTTAGPAEPKKREVRIREFFPETLLFAPALIADSSGVARLKVPMADSITTWRMTASANGKQGGLGAVSHGIRVFQDFFVDLDLPVALTQNDEVSIPVVVYNYLKGAQKVRLELEPQDWFELQGNRVQEMQLGPDEVASTYYRVRVRGLGRRTLQVRADGSSMSDAVRREIEILPDGKEQNLVRNGRLEGKLEAVLDIPKTAVAGASKILVRLYPGVFSQVIEGMESLLRLPGG